MTTDAPAPGSTGYINILDHGKADLMILFARLDEWGMYVANVLPDGTLVLREKEIP